MPSSTPSQTCTYKLPNDFSESQRLNLQHQIWTKLVGGLYPTDLRDTVEQRLKCTSSPEVLDVGCGTGIWAIEMCKRFPEVQVTGLDLTDWNLGDSSLPKNYIFTKCDLASGLSIGLQGRFDLIQCRAVLQHVPDPQSLTEDLARCLKPGGILLLADGELSQGSFDRTRKKLKPFIYDYLVSAEQNKRRGEMDREICWFAGWLCAFGKGLESPRYRCPGKLAQASRLLCDIKLRDIWMDVPWSEDFLGRGRKQGVEELICINYLKAFDAVRPVLMKQGIPESFIRDIWQPKIVDELKTYEFTSLWHYTSAVRVGEFC